MIPPPAGGPVREVVLILPGLNLHPERLSPWRALLTSPGRALALPVLTGYRFPGDPALKGVRADDWLDDVHAAWKEARRFHPDAAVSLCGFSLGALLGLVWSLEAAVPLERGLLISPALRLRPSLRAGIAAAGAFLPARWLLPSRAPRDYRFHGRTSIAAYSAVAGLERRLAPHLRGWLAGEPPPPLLIAYARRDELIDTRTIAALCRAAPEQVVGHRLRHRPRFGFPRHLGVDPHTLGAAEWNRLAAAVAGWLEATELPVPEHRPAARKSAP